MIDNKNNIYVKVIEKLKNRQNIYTKSQHIPNIKL